MFLFFFKNLSEQQITIRDVWFLLRVALSRLWYSCVNVKTSTLVLRATCARISVIVAEFSPRCSHCTFLSEEDVNALLTVVSSAEKIYITVTSVCVHQFGRRKDAA